MQSRWQALSFLFCNVIVDMQDYERTQATIRLMNELAKGRLSGETEGWLTPDDMMAHFRARANEE